jgi:hypothetical protein
MKIFFHDTGKGSIFVDYNWDGKDGYQKRAVAKKTDTGKWTEVEVRMNDLNFLTGREMPEPDFRVYSEDGKLALQKIEVRFWQ